MAFNLKGRELKINAFSWFSGVALKNHSLQPLSSAKLYKEAQFWAVKPMKAPRLVEADHLGKKKIDTASSSQFANAFLAGSGFRCFPTCILAVTSTR